MKRFRALTVALAVLAVTTVLALFLTAPAPTPEAAAPGSEAVSTTPGPDAVSLEDLLDGSQVACGCRDLCTSDLQCLFVCGGQPGQCVMVNSCCRECVCVASS